MARKTKGPAGRRPGQSRPRAAAAPARRVVTRTPGGEASVEERLAELELERERLLDASGAATDEEMVAGAEVDSTEAATAADGEDDDGTTAREPAAVTRVPQKAASARTAAARAASPTAGAGTRRVGRVTPAAPLARAPRAARAGAPRDADTLDPDDPSIPLERVPYVQADLRRVGIIAVLMVLLIIIADIVVNVVVK